MCLKPLLRFALFVGIFLTATSTRADWINLTGAETAPNIAEITIYDDRVEVALEVYVGDLEVFEALIPDDWLEKMEVERKPLADRLANFSQQGLRFVTDIGETLQAELRLVEPRLRKDRYSPFAGMVNPFTRQRVGDAPADKRVLYAELVYPFGETEPETLTMFPPLDDEGVASVSLGFIVYHKSVPVIDFRFLSAPSTLTLHPDPWYSRFDNPNLKRHHKDALMSFLYVEPYEVRHEILTRVKDLENWMDLGLKGDRYIEVDELEPLKQRIGEFLLGRNPVLIDGQAVKPILDRSNYIKVSLTGIKLLEKPERLEISSAIVGVIITYITDGIPQQVTVDWELFTDQIQRVPATSKDPAGSLPTFLFPKDNVHTWTNFLKDYELPMVQTVSVAGTLGNLRIPLITLACGLLALLALMLVIRAKRKGISVTVPVTSLLLLIVIGAAAYPYARVSVDRPTAMAGTLDPDQAKELLQVLLKNVYRAFDFRKEEDVYDKLAVSVSGDLLADIYLQNRRSFAVQQAGGAQAKIKSVEIEEAVAERLDDRLLAYTIKGNWIAQGSVGHWGHTHTRRNRYDAILTVEAIDGAWKITDLEVLEEKRIDPAQSSVAAAATNNQTGQDTQSQ